MSKIGEIMNKKIILILILISSLSLSGCLESEGMAKDSVHSYEQDIIFGTWKFWFTNDHPTGNVGEEGYYSAIYSVEKNNIELINKLKTASGTKDIYVIRFTNKLVVMPWDYASNTIITSIEPVNSS